MLGSLRSRILVAGTVAASAIAIAVGAVSPSSSITCDSSVSTSAALVSALGNTANSGKTVCVTANITGGIITASTHFTSQATFTANPADMSITLPEFHIDGAQKLTLQGFNIPAGGIQVENNTASSNIQILKNHIHDYTGNGIEIIGGVTDSNFTITGNNIECLNYNPNDGGPTGYGVLNDSTMNTFTISYNTVKGCGNTGDGMQLADMHNGSINNNVIDHIGYNGVGTNPHPDTIMLWSTSSSVTLSNNRFTNGTGTLISPDGTDITFTNNLIAHHQDPFGSDQCVDATKNGSSGSISPLRFTFTQNTIWDCGNGGINMNQPTGTRGSNVADRNLVVDVECLSPTVWSSTDNHNLEGGNSGCWPGATNIHNFSPTFADQTDLLPTNLPTGYSDVGYRAVPAGYTAAP